MPDENFAEPAVVAMLRGVMGDHVVALRADMDALPIRENSGVPFSSHHEGIMHACGHDAHVAMLLGAARLLQARQSELPGHVRLIFQPSEEKHPGGALALIEQGVLESPPVEAIFGQHVQTHIPVGKLGIMSGPFMAASDDFTIRIIGCSCHAAHPEQGIDAIVIAAQVILALQSIVSRNTDPVQPIVLSVSTIEGGKKTNIVADCVTMRGTLRTLSEEVRARTKERMQHIVGAVAVGNGGEGEIDFEPGYPVVYNDPDLSAQVKASAAAVLGEKNVFAIAHPTMGGEDFSRYQQHCPGVYTNLGCGNAAAGISAPIHTEKFRIDLDCLPLGAALLAQQAWDYLCSL